LEDAAMMAHKLRSWVSTRNLIKAQAETTARFAEEHRELAAKLRCALAPRAIEVNTPGEDAAMDLLEAEKITQAKPDPFFSPVDAALAMVRPPHLAEGA
jgi:hypothetical protein